MNKLIGWVLTSALLGGCLAEGTGGNTMMHNVDSEFDFIVEMIPHHQEAVDTATATLQRTQRPELQAFAQGIVTAQTSEIQSMTAWLAEWYPGKDATANYQPMMAPVHGLSADRADRSFLEGMIMHHKMAVLMANDLLKKNLSQRPQVLDLAQAIITTQNQEIETMEKWLKEWYGVTSGGMQMMH